MNPRSVRRVRRALAACAAATVLVLPACSDGGDGVSGKGASDPEKEGPKGGALFEGERT